MTQEPTATVRPIGRAGEPHATLLAEMSRPRQVVEAFVGPAVVGVLCGVLLGVGQLPYLIAVLIAVVLGAVVAAGQHRTVRGSTLRAAFGGAVWALALLATHAATGARATVALPEPELSLVVWAIVPNSLLAAVVKLVRRRAGN